MNQPSDKAIDLLIQLMKKTSLPKILAERKEQEKKNKRKTD